MKEFFLILFFSKWVALTPQPIDIEYEIVLNPEKPLTAITGGAGVHIDLGDFAPAVGIKRVGIEESMRILNEMIPPERVSGYLLTGDGQRISLDKAYFSLENDQAWMVLTSSSGIPTGPEFVTLSIRSSVEIRGVSVYWKNYRH
jgi:hypothetical protein